MSDPIAPASHPLVLLALTNRPLHGRSSIQVVCPSTGSNLTATHPLPCRNVRSLTVVPRRRRPSALFVGHDDDNHAFLLHGGNCQWSVRLAEALTAGLAVSPTGQLVAAGSATGSCYLWEWTAGKDNLLSVWPAHHRAVTCVAFDEDGATLLTAAEDGVVHAWCVLERGPAAGLPICTWAEHHLAVTALCVLPGSGNGSLRVVSSSLDRQLIVMEVGSMDRGTKPAWESTGTARTLARICLPSGLHSVICDSLSGSLYAAGADGTIFCVDIDAYAIHETFKGGGNYVPANPSKDASFMEGNFDSILAANHLLSNSVGSASNTMMDSNKYVSELRGHVKPVLSLALLDPSDLMSMSMSTSANHNSLLPLLASGSEDGTIRIWDLCSRSCVRVVRPWAPSSDGLSTGNANSTPTTSPPITSLISVSRFSLTSSENTLAMTPIVGSHSSRHSRTNNGINDLVKCFHPLARFVHGSSVALVDSVTDKQKFDSIPSGDCVSFLWPCREESTMTFWEDAPSTFHNYSLRQNKKSRLHLEKEDDAAKDRVEIAQLKKELEESRVVIERWQVVNNQLMDKLKSNGIPL